MIYEYQNDFHKTCLKNSNFNESLYVERNRLNVRQFLSKGNFFERMKSTPEFLASFEYNFIEKSLQTLF